MGFIRQSVHWGLLLAGVLQLTQAYASEDLAGLPRYRNATLEQSVSEQVQNYPLVASRLKKVNGQVRADRDDYRNGRLERRLYKIPSGHSSDQAFKDMHNHLKKLGVKPLFTCKGRDCGSSNFWANRVFEVSSLYGYDGDQRYFLGKRSVQNSEEYYLLYSTRRGNRRVYLLLDQLRVAP